MTETAKETTPEDVALEKAVGAVIPLIEDGTITWDKLAQAIAPDVAPVKAPERVPIARKVSDVLKLQIKKLPDVFGVVAPIEVRRLEPAEVSGLLAERDVLDDVVDELGKRKDDIREIVLNHFDAEMIDTKCLVADNDGLLCFSAKGHDGDCAFQFVPRTLDGHFVPQADKEKWTERGEPSNTEQFSWERRSNTKATISPAMLKALADDPNEPDISHEDYLAMTEQTRVFDENKAMIAIKKNPKLVRAIAKATRPGNVSAALFVRKAGK